MDAYAKFHRISILSELKMIDFTYFILFSYFYFISIYFLILDLDLGL